MERKGDLMNQLAIISDLIENLAVETKTSIVTFEMDEKDFNTTFEIIEKKIGKKTEKPNETFTITIGNVDIIFNKSSV